MEISKAVLDARLAECQDALYRAIAEANMAEGAMRVLKALIADVEADDAPESST